MGTFIGHAAPGILFILYAVWSAVKQAHNHLQLINKSHPTCDNNSHNDGLTSTYRKMKTLNEQAPHSQDVPLFRDDVLIGGVIFLLFSIGGAIGVIGYGGWSLICDGTFCNMNNWQHGTMFALFGLHFAITILSQTKYRIDPSIGKLCQSMAFFVEALLFFYHLHDRSELDIHIHTLLIIAILGSAVCTLAEVWN